MAVRRKAKLHKDQRLDLFLQNLQIAEEKRQQIVQYVEELTFQTLYKKPQELRLKK